MKSMLIFIIALQSPKASANWERVSLLCERTLRSVCAQSHSDFRVFLVCNERPLGNFEHPALQIIEENFPLPERNTPSRMTDKWSKIKRGLIEARNLAPAHIMIMDADDCVHRDLAVLVAKHPVSRGWNFSNGYMHDEGTQWLYRVNDFDIRCGTSAIVRLEKEDFPKSMSEQNNGFFILEHGHGEIGRYMREQGKPLEILPFRGAIYITATGENDSHTSLHSWRGKKIFIKKLLNSRRLTSSLRKQFGLYDLQS